MITYKGFEILERATITDAAYLDRFDDNAKWVIWHPAIGYPWDADVTAVKSWIGWGAREVLAIDGERVKDKDSALMRVWNGTEEGKPELLCRIYEVSRHQAYWF